MAGPRPGEVVEPFEFVVLIDDLQADGAAQRGVVPDAGEQLNGVGLDSLAATAAIAPLAASQFDVDWRGIELDPRWEAIDDGQQRFAVRFAGSPVAQRHVRTALGVISVGFAASQSLQTMP